jgi:hypothetical protein
MEDNPGCYQGCYHKQRKPETAATSHPSPSVIVGLQRGQDPAVLEFLPTTEEAKNRKPGRPKTADRAFDPTCVTGGLSDEGRGSHHIPFMSLPQYALHPALHAKVTQVMRSQKLLPPASPPARTRTAPRQHPRPPGGESASSKLTTKRGPNRVVTTNSASAPGRWAIQVIPLHHCHRRRHPRRRHRTRRRQVRTSGRIRNRPDRS